MFSGKNFKFVSLIKPPGILSHLILIVFLLIYVSGQRERDVSSRDNLPVCGLCQANVTSVSCSHQVSSYLKEDACLMYPLNKNSSTCSDESFTGDFDEENKWNDFTMSTFLYQHISFHHIPSFNLSFSKIKWVYMKMRFKDVDTSRVAVCEEFRVNPHLVDELFFDCLWDRGSYQNKPFIFEYLIKTPSGNKYLHKYLFHVPNSDDMWKHDSNEEADIKDRKVFSMVDLSNMDYGLPLKVEALPPSLNVTVYKIKMTYLAPDKSFSEITEVKVNHHQHKSSFTVLFHKDGKLKPGSYNFSVTFEHPQCGQTCSVSTTPVVYFKDTGRRGTIEIILGAVVLTSVCIIIYFSIKSKMKKSCNVSGMNKPKVLLIYNPVSVEHVNTMKKLYSFFQSYPMDVMIDIVSIPQSEQQCPETWYIRAFKEANFVFVFTSPKLDSEELEKVTRALIFSNTYSIAEAHLQRAASSVHAKCKFFSVLLPNTSWKTLPDVAVYFKRFSLPQDVKPLLKAVGVKAFNAKNQLSKALGNKMNSVSEQNTITIDLSTVVLKEINPPVCEREESPPPIRNQCYQCKQPEVYQLEPSCPLINDSPQSSRSSSPDCFT